MSEPKPRLTRFAPDFLALTVVWAFTVIGLAWWLYPDLTFSRLSEPLVNGDDPLFVSALIKIIRIENWWPFQLIQTAHLGAPYGFQLGDYPMGDQFQFSLLRILASFVDSPMAVYNTYFVASFFLCGLSFYICARVRGVPRTLAVPLSIGFTLLPYHFYRYIHVLFAAYYLLPPLCLLVLNLTEDRIPIAIQNGADTLQSKWRLTNRRQFWFSLVIVGVASFSGIYYAFFFCFFLTLALFISRTPKAQVPRIAWYLLQVILMMGLGLTNYLPNFSYLHDHGPNPIAAGRNVIESEIAGFRLSTFLLPTNQHVLTPVREKVESYTKQITPVEGDHEYAGLLTLIGFFAGALALFTVRESAARRTGLLLIPAVLFSTIGGLCIPFAIFLTPSFRSQDRISIYLCCFSLLLIGSLLGSWWRTKRWWIQIGLALLVIMVCLIDQVPRDHGGIAPQDEAQVQDEKAFFSSIDSVCRPGANVLQLPFSGFPEAPSVGLMKPYEHLKAFLYNDHVNWSYASMRGRMAVDAIVKLSQFPFQIDQLRAAGIDGIEIDLAGFNPDEQNVLRQYFAKWPVAALHSGTSRLNFIPFPNSRCSGT